MVPRVSAAFDKLTPREREILRLIAAHLQSKEIARALGLSPKTVEMHVLSARRRLSGMSRRDAALAFVAWEGDEAGGDPERPSPEDRLGRSVATSGEASAATVRPNWRYELNGLQWLGLVLGVTLVAAMSLAAIAISLDALIMAIQRIMHY